MFTPITAPRYHQHGFTILEMLVVVLIVGVIVSMVSLSVGSNPNKVLREEAQRLSALLELAQQQAILNSQEMALQVDDESYQFLVYDGEDLLPLEDRLFRQRELPEGMLISAEVEGQAATEDLFGETEASQILIYSSGELTPFVITLELEDGPSYELNGDLMGTLELASSLES